MAIISKDQHKTAVAAYFEAQSEAAEILAGQLSLPLTSVDDDTYPLLLVITGERLELHQPGRKKPGPVYVDFIKGKAGYRRRKGVGRHEMIVRAVGRIPRERPTTVFDATAGLGCDAFVLASRGCHVTMCEQNPILAALLQDGLKRAEKDKQTSEIIKGRITLHHGDSLTRMRKIGERGRPDVVSLDPMFPPRTKSSSVKKEMQVLQELLGKDQNGEKLLAEALRTAKRRVIVKRPASAPHLGDRKPDLQYKTKKNRFDVFLITK